MTILSVQRSPGLSRQAGFTYVGIMILITVIGIATAATATVAETARRRIAEEELLITGKQYIKAILEYELHTPAGHANRAPARLEDLLRDPRQAGVRRYIRQLYPDPITGKLDWQLVLAPGGGIMGIKSASCANSIKRSFTEGDFTYLDGKGRYCDWVFAYVMACGANCKDGEKAQREMN